MRAFFQTVFSMRRLAVILGVAAACLLVGLFGQWLFGPAMAPLLPRLLAILAILALWLGAEAVLFLLNQRANSRVLKGLQQASRDVPAADDEPDELHDQLVELFDYLRRERIGRGLASDFAYALPWYLLIGPRQSGKSALVTQSHLRMPVEERLGRRPIQTRVDGHATRWWFTDEALLISTPAQGAPQPGQHDTWRGVLSFLTRYRPRRPLDGVLVVVGADMLMDGQGPALAALMRARLADAMRALSARLQIYVVVTKCDRLTGFEEFFSVLDAETRARPLGAALPVNAGRTGRDAMAQLRQLLEASLAGVTRLLPFHAAAERDVTRRARMVALPEQLSLLSGAAAAFAGELTEAGRFDRQMVLRGVFFTAAGTAPAERAALIDGWEARFAQPAGLRVAGAPARPAGRGEPDRAYFVSGLFRDIIFPQAGLAGRNPKAERRTAAIFLTAYAVCLLALLGSGLFWLEEFNNHQATLAKFRAGVHAEQGLVQTTDPHDGIPAVLPLLDKARALTTLDHGDTTAERDFSLSPLGIPAAHRAAVDGYHALLLSQLLPAIAQQLGQQLRHAMATGASPGTLRQLLTVYLMLGEPQHYDAGTVANWTGDLVSATFPLDPVRRASASAHLQTLLTLLPAPVQLDRSLVSEVRGLLHQNPDADLIYARLKEESLRSSLAAPLDVVGSLGAAGAQLLMLRSQAGLPVVVPALYTRDGFYQIFLTQAPKLVRNVDSDQWIMGTQASSDPGVASAVLQQVTNLYVQDYIKQWQSVLAQMALRALPDLPSLVGGLQTLSGPDSPLIQFIQLVKTQTDLAVPPAPQTLLGKATAAATQAGAKAGAGEAAQAAAAALPQPPANPLGLPNWPGDAIRMPFAPLQALLNAGSGQAPVLRVQDTLVAAYGVVSGVSSAQDPGAAALQTAAKVISGQGGDPLIGLRVQAATLPQPIDGIFRELYQNIWGTLLRMTRERVQATWARDVTPVCEQSIARRYPFVGGSDGSATVDVTLQDFSAFFGRNGVIDQFVSKNLAPFTDPGPNGALVLSSQNGLSLGLSSQGMDQINRARRFRDLFFDSSGNLQVQFALTPAYLDPRALSATLSMDQTKLVYRHQPPRPTQFSWPPVNAAGDASLVIKTTDGQTLDAQTSGAWAIFRLLGMAGKSAPGGNDQLQFNFTLGGIQASFGLRASSVVNPFSVSDFTEFRCVPRL